MARSLNLGGLAPLLPREEVEMRLWPWPRRRPVPAVDPDPDHYMMADWVRDLADTYREDPGVTVWQGMVEDTRLLPIVTPGEEIRRQGGGGW